MLESKQTKPFFGWRIVVAVFVLATFGWGLGFYGPPVFLHAVQAARGWSLAIISAGVTIHFLFGAVVVANLPKLYETFGVPRVTKAGCVALVAGIAGWAWAREPYQFYAATLLSGAGWGSMGAAAVNAIIALWFVRERPKALSAAYNGSSVGGIVFSPLWVGGDPVVRVPTGHNPYRYRHRHDDLDLGQRILRQDADDDGIERRW